MQAHAEHASAQVDAAASSLVAPSPDGFLPHGVCYLWNKPLVLTHLASDVLIGLSYVAISFALAYLVHRARRDIPFSVIFVAFGLFIVACGMTHFMEVWTLWQPVYWLSGGVKVVTAAASVATAAAMPFTVPQALTTIRDARLSRERELAAARAAALEEQNELLHAQAAELEQQTEEAQHLAEELERANQAMGRTAAEAEAARRRAEEASRAKSDFLATMSHELRTPLNAIAGHVQLIQLGIHGSLTTAQREALERVERAQLHLLGLINDVLNFTRIESGRVEYDVREVPVAEVVAEATAMVEPQLAARHLAYEVRLDGSAGPAGPGGAPILVWADREKLRQILINLLSNAAKFTPEGGRVTVETVARDDGSTPADVVFVRVADTGVGIPPDKLEAIFDPFVQVNAGLTRTQEGTGLGLAISRDLARGMGGELRARSAVGVGSTFTLTVRRVMPPAPGEGGERRSGDDRRGDDRRGDDRRGAAD